MTFKFLLVPLLVFGLAGCEFFRSINKEEVRTAVEIAAIETITILNERGFDPVALSPREVELATSACRIVGTLLVEGSRIEDPVEKEELRELMLSVCRVLGVGLSATEVTEEEVPVDG